MDELSVREGSISLSEDIAQSSTSGGLVLAEAEAYADSGDANTLTAAEDYTDGPLTVVEKGSDWTLDNSILGGVLIANSAGAINFTIPTSIATKGDTCRVIRYGAGTVTMVQGASTTMQAPYGASISTQFGSALIFWYDATHYIVTCE